MTALEVDRKLYGPGEVRSAHDIRAALLKGMTVSMVLALAFQSIPVPIQVSIVPLTTVLALAATPMLLASQPRIERTPLAGVVLIFFGFLILHSTVAVFIDIVIRQDDLNRLVSWLRQVIALVAGISVFLVLRSTLGALSDQKLARLITFGAIPGVIIALLNVAWGLLGSEAAKVIVISVREFLAPHGYNYPFRASGLSLEPSHFVWYLTVLILPVAMLQLEASRRGSRLFYAVFLVSALVSFVWTFSGTGFVIAAVMVLGTLRWMRATWILAMWSAVVVSVATIVFVFPQNYFVATFVDFWRAVEAADLSLLTPSLMIAFFSTFGPFLTADSSLTSLGYGLGGTSSHLDAMVPPLARDAIIRTTWEGMPSLGNMVGKLFAEAGLIGLLLFLSLWVVALKQLRAIRRTSSPERSALDLTLAAQFAMVGLLVGYSIKHASFSIPFLWFWLAYIDSRYTSSRIA